MLMYIINNKTRRYHRFNTETKLLLHNRQFSLLRSNLLNSYHL